MLKNHVALGLAVISATTFAFMSGEWYALSRVSPTDRLDVSAFEWDSRLSSDLGDWAAAAVQAVSVPARPSDKIPASAIWRKSGSAMMSSCAGSFPEPGFLVSKQRLIDIRADDLYFLAGSVYLSIWMRSESRERLLYGVERENAR